MRAKAFGIAITLVALALGYRIYTGRSLPPLTPTSTAPMAPEVGKLNSAHLHMSLVISIYGRPLDLYQDRYIDQSEDVHFHADDVGGYFIHTHTTGITLPYFLSTLGIGLAGDCLSLDTGEKYCANNLTKLNVLINRTSIQNLDYYVMREGDKILIDYGTSTPTELMLEANGVPDLPDALSDKI